MAKNDVRLGRFISYVLRHHPEKIHLHMDHHGWVHTDELIRQMNQYGYVIDQQTLDRIVATNNKHRYSYNADHTLIRANQGHSIPVDVEMPECVPPDVLYHGTGVKSVSAILKEGIRPMGRLYVHLSPDQKTAEMVGRRHGEAAIFAVDTRRMHEDGVVFYLSANHVWQTEYVAPQYLKRIM